mmetsp:Transcript_34705/g.81014  ORF Transcript_34705/g.81014 Transcript_34705/m.81014 type:complete len:127 (+) Transcript_34705:499-879(+)
MHTGSGQKGGGLCRLWFYKELRDKFACTQQSRKASAGLARDHIAPSDKGSFGSFSAGHEVRFQDYIPVPLQATNCASKLLPTAANIAGQVLLGGEEWLRKHLRCVKVHKVRPSQTGRSSVTSSSRC